MFKWDTAFPLAYIHIIKNIPRQSTTICGPVKAKKLENNYPRFSSEIKISFYSKFLWLVKDAKGPEEHVLEAKNLNGKLEKKWQV